MIELCIAILLIMAINRFFRARNEAARESDVFATEQTVDTNLEDKFPRIEPYDYLEPAREDGDSFEVFRRMRLEDDHRPQPMDWGHSSTFDQSMEMAREEHMKLVDDHFHDIALGNAFDHHSDES